MPRWTVGALIMTVVVSIFVVTARNIGLPYDSIGPGGTHDVGRLVTVTGHQTFPARGRILYTTVSVREQLNFYQAVAGWIDPDVDVVPARRVRGSIPPDQYRRLNIDAMADSKTVAQVLALRHLGYTDLGAGAEVVMIDPGLPAAQVLKPNDVIVAVDGAPVSVSSDAVARIRARQPGERVRLRIVRGEQPMDVESDLVRGEEGQALLGVRLTTKVRLPFQVEIDSGDVVGPSAGLAYALELLDILTPGELTGGVPVAATGELAPDGAVGAVGGVEQKAVAARQAGVKVFLVPRANLEEAEAEAGDELDVRAVDTFEHALRELGSLSGSNALALGKPGTGPSA